MGDPVGHETVEGPGRGGRVPWRRRVGPTQGIAENVLALVGATPLVRLSRVSNGGGELLAKLESMNPGGSVKDRTALAMVLAAERDGRLRAGSTLVEATSGNTGISLAMIAAVRGYRCVLVLPEDMSLARRYLVKAYGAEVVLTAASLGMAGAVERALELLGETPGAVMLRQFENPANPDTHEVTTGEEILAQTGGRLDAVVAGVGTGGTLTGVARSLRRRGVRALVVAVEPAGSPVLSGGSAGLHGIQGLGAGFVPKTLDRALVDRVVKVSDVAAERMARRLAREEGLLVGLSSGANVHAALAVAEELGPSSRVVTVLCDTGERYLF
jgi:cysteine synthase A